MAEDLEEDRFGHSERCLQVDEIAIAEVHVRELKKSASLPISISTPCPGFGPGSGPGIGFSLSKGLDCNHVTED